MKIRFSKVGFEKLKKKFERLNSERPSAVLDLKKAREMGDLSENGYYKSARAKLSSIDRNLKYLTHQIKNAYVVEQIQGIGVVGDLEANPSERKISLLSPIGRALENRKIGEIVEIKTPNGNTFYKIIKIW